MDYNKTLNLPNTEFPMRAGLPQREPEALKAWQENGCYDFDITGGSSVFIAAAGALMAECGEGRMCIHEYDPVTGRCLYCYPPNIPCLSGVGNNGMEVTEFLALRDIGLLGGIFLRIAGLLERRFCQLLLRV